jgi:hypothetical protein
MLIKNILEKISWKLRRVRVKLILFSIGYDGGDSSFKVVIMGVLNNLKVRSLFTWSFRLPNKTTTRVFITDEWDFLYLKHFLYEKYLDLCDRELWNSKSMSRIDKITVKILSKLF